MQACTSPNVSLLIDGMPNMPGWAPQKWQRCCRLPRPLHVACMLWDSADPAKSQAGAQGFDFTAAPRLRITHITSCNWGVEASTTVWHVPGADAATPLGHAATARYS